VPLIVITPHGEPLFEVRKRELKRGLQRSLSGSARRLDQNRNRGHPPRMVQVVHRTSLSHEATAEFRSDAHNEIHTLQPGYMNPLFAWSGPATG
jgi:hypothetical protein